MSSVPAWKRLGLKLKGPAPATAPNPQSSIVSTQDSHHHHTNGLSSSSSGNKRKLLSTPASAQKKARYDSSQPSNGHDPNQTPVVKKRKSVSFAPDTKSETTTPSAKWTPATTYRQHSLADSSDFSPVSSKKFMPKKKKKNKGPPKKLKPTPLPNLETALAYLRTWKADRDNWKFNKNHQISLLRHIFSPPDPKALSNSTIPAQDIPTLIEYIRDIKGFVRTRLREAAEEVKQADMAPHTPTNTGFPEGTEDVTARQAEYEELIRTFLTQPATPGINNPRYSFSFSETEFLRTHPDTNAFVTRRVVKRMRSEMVLDAIESDSDASEASAASEATASTIEAQEKEKRPVDKRVKLNDGTLQRVKRKRKIRTADIDSNTSSDESSSSDSDSDSENDADSESESNSGSGSESGSGSDEGEGEAEADDDEATSSSDDNSSEDGEEVKEAQAPPEVTEAGGSAQEAETSSDSDATSSSESESGSEGDAEESEGTKMAHGRVALDTSSSSESSDAEDGSH
ncbi:uncharacterized protein MKZ38_002940 [Zalerion maritima]|uniref:WKF domain-containing protein n=1 Tax=Zalerion maritima TaxID=339359 RepID=A0AAD5RPW8_9PEZI|nr:uncharacterized protein MKZ38_002940 [Zalerion maritima]